MQVNTLFFGFYFLTIATLHILHVFLADPITTSSTYLFASYSLLQSALETLLLIALGNFIQNHLPRLMNLFILSVFFLFLSHLIDFPLVRLVNMTFWYALHFVSQETTHNLFELLLASNVSLGIWGLLFISSALLIASGLLLYRWAERYTSFLKPPHFLLLLSIGFLSLLGLDYLIEATKAHPHRDRLTKTLPWKHTLFPLEKPCLTLNHPLQESDSEDVLLQKLDSRFFSLNHKPDIYLIIVESIRSDFITEETTPHLHAFKTQNLSFPLTLSNANYTHGAWFSLFHSKFPFHWKGVEETQTGSLPLHLLKKMGYKIHVSSSARLTYYQMNRRIFGEGEYLADSLFIPSEEYDEPYLRDQSATEHLLSKMQTPGSGRVFILFLDAPHFDYSWPQETSPFTPFENNINYLKLAFSNNNLQSLINSYKNSLHFVDSLLGTFLNALYSSPQGKEALVIFTADHGQEFYEQGNLFHTSAFSHPQISPPIYYRFGTNTPLSSTSMTCHMDIFPTLFHYLVGEDLLQDVLQGQSIFNSHRWPYTVTAKFNASRVPYEYCIHNGSHKLLVEFCNDAAIFSSKELKILSTTNSQDEPLPYNPLTIQEEFGSALERLFPPSK